MSPAGSHLQQPSSASSSAVDIILCNAGNHANAVFLAIRWFCEQANRFLQPPDPALRASLQKVFSGEAPVHLSRQHFWQTHFSRWELPYQQDAAEFLQDAGPQLIQPDLIGDWETRLLSTPPSASSHTTDPGDGRYGIGHTLPVLITAALASDSRSPCTLQSLVEKWHIQSWHGIEEARTAINGGPELLVLQIARFNDMGHKVIGIVQLSFPLQVPVFSDVHLTTSVTPAPYEVVSIVFHEGHTSRSGHYRAALLTNGVITHSTDDGRSAKPASSEEVVHINNNSYLFFLRRLH